MPLDSSIRRTSGIRSQNVIPTPEVPEQSLLAQFFFRFYDIFFFFIEEKLRRFLSSIFFDLSSSNFFSPIFSKFPPPLNFFNLFQSTYCSKFLSPIFFFLLTSTLLLDIYSFVEKNSTNGSRPRQPTSSMVPR